MYFIADIYADAVLYIKQAPSVYAGEIYGIIQGVTKIIQ